MIIHVCDKCGKKEEQAKGTANRNLPDKWFALTFNLSYSGHRRYDICPKCRTKMGIPDNYQEAAQYTGDQLVEIISEIAAEECQNQGQ